MVGAKGRGFREGVLFFLIIVPLLSNITIIHVAGESGKEDIYLQGMIKVDVCTASRTNVFNE